MRVRLVARSSILRNSSSRINTGNGKVCLPCMDPGLQILLSPAVSIRPPDSYKPQYSWHSGVVPRLNPHPTICRAVFLLLSREQAGERPCST